MASSPGLPEGMTCAVALTFDVDAEAPILDTDPRSWRDASTMTHQAFGPQVGVPRILRLLREENLQATFFVPGWTARRWPTVVDAILEEGHEVGHHSDLHRHPPTLTPEEEREDFARALETLQSFGTAVRGHRAAYWRATWTTIRLVAEFGLRYDSSLMDEDRPYVLGIDGRKICEIPVSWSLDDWEQYGFLLKPQIGTQIETPSKVVELWTAEIEAQRKEGGIVVLTMHPFLTGRASRVEGLRQVIDYARSAADVWIAPTGQIAESVLAAGLQPRSLHPPDLSLGPYPEN
jgi:peptidoglycan/xylan/chitin deacetylase (PgdA/CDA1 family)